MKRDDFLRDVRTYCRKNGLSYGWDAKHGKGSHGRVTVGERFTTVPAAFEEHLKRAILKQLGLPPDAA